MEGAMAKILVGTYRSRRDADDARRQLLERGFGDAQISVEGPGAEEASASGATTDVEAWNAPASEARGLAAVIARMFSGLLPDKADHERYERAIRTGAVLVAVHGLDEAAVERAKPILERNGTVDLHAHAGTGDFDRPEPSIEPSAPQTSSRGATEAETWSPRRPDETPLPNAPSGWDEARDGERASAGRGTHDPARPEGLTRGTNQLGADLDRQRLDRGRKR
jgi:hypothetical protein